MRLCSRVDCDKKHWCRGLCRKHYRQLPDVRAKDSQYAARPETRARLRERYAERSDVREKAAAWARTEKSKMGKAKRHMRVRYGLSQEALDEMWRAQGGRCAMRDCRIDMEPAVTKSYKSAHVDHCHKTGRVRALLCMRCNLALGRYEDTKHRFLSFDAYLRRSL